MLLDLTPDELLSTTRAVRKRLDLERPVEREVLEDCLRLAQQAPTASYSQNWHFVVVTDAALTKTQAKRVAIMAQDGLARAIYPVHMPHDGDTVFSAATAKRPAPDLLAFTELCALAANVLTRAIARGVYEATALPFAGALPGWKDKFG